MLHNTPPRVRVATLKHNYARVPNLINGVILSLSRYGFHLRNAYQLLITIILQSLLHMQPPARLLGIMPISSLPQCGSPILLLGHSYAYISYTRRQKLYNWFSTILTDSTTNTSTEAYLSNHSRIPMLIKPIAIVRMIKNAHQTVITDLYHFLTYIEWITLIRNLSSTTTLSFLTPKPIFWTVHTPASISHLPRYTTTSSTYINHFTFSTPATFTTPCTHK